MRKLSLKEEAFVNEYFITGMNATEAGRRLNYKHPNVQGARLLAKDSIKAEIQRRLQERQLSADEVLARLGDMARGSLGDFIKFYDGIKEPYIDVQGAADKGLLHLVKKLKYNDKGQPEIELYDAQSALEKIGKHHGLFKDVQEHSGEIGTYEMSLEEWRKAQEERRKISQQTLQDFDDE